VVGWMEEGETMTTYYCKLAALTIAVLDYYHPHPLPEAVAWLLPAVGEALLSRRDRQYQRWIYRLFVYVARECGVPDAKKQRKGNN
jgi:hypothetical protein